MSNDKDIDSAVQVELLNTLFYLMPRAVPAYLIGGPLVVLALWTQADHLALFAWLTALFAVTGLRVLTLRRFAQVTLTPELVPQWGRIAVVNTFITGVVLGGSVLAFVDHADATTILVLTGVILATTSSGVAVLAPHLACYWWFAAPSMGTLMVVLLSSPDTSIQVVGAVCVMTQVSNSMIAINLYQAMQDSVRLSFDNRKLMQVAQQADIAKTRFLASASHDLRQPLHALGLFIAALARKVRGPENNELLDQIDGSLNNVNTMLGTLLDVSKLDAGVVKVKLAEVDLQTLFDRLEQEFRPLAQENGNRLRFRSTRLRLTTDAGLFERILRNLVSNALRYTHNGRVLVAVRRRGQRAICGVYDNGPGIPAEQQLVIFDEFHQLANPERDRNQGLGLGLAIVRRTADLLDHPLELISVVGHGSCFFVSIPIATSPAASVGSAVEQGVGGDAELAGLMVLLVDDDAVVVQAMTTLLHGWGCRVESSESMDGALALVSHAQGIPDVMLVDYRLRNEVTGDQVISAIHAQLGLTVPAIIITGDTAPARIKEASAAGYPLLHKPVRPTNLRGTLSALLKQNENRSDGTE